MSTPRSLRNDGPKADRFGPRYRDGMIYSAPQTGVATVTVGNGVLYAHPVWWPGGAILTSLCAAASSGGGAGSVVRLGAFRDNGEGAPGNLLVDAGTIDTTGTTPGSISLTTVIPEDGWYWPSGVAQGAPTPNPTMRMSVPLVPPFHPTIASLFGGTTIGLYKTGVTGALPATFGDPAADSANNVIRVGFTITNA